MTRADFEYRVVEGIRGFDAATWAQFNSDLANYEALLRTTDSPLDLRDAHVPNLLTDLGFSPPEISKLRSLRFSPNEAKPAQETFKEHEIIRQKLIELGLPSTPKLENQTSVEEKRT